VVEDAAASGLEGLDRFYSDVLEYVVSDPEAVSSDPAQAEMIELTVQEIVENDFRGARGLLWQIFELTLEVDLRVAIADALGHIAVGDPQVAADMAGFLEVQVRSFSSGGAVDTRVILAVIKALGAIGESISFGPLLAAASSDLPGSLSEEARSALQSLEGELPQVVLDVARSPDLAARLEALKIAFDSQDLELFRKAELATQAFEAALASSSADEQDQQTTREMRRLAIRVLAQARWSRASRLALKHFAITEVEYEVGDATLADMVEAVQGLGAMATHDAAVRLALYLQTLNSQKESGESVEDRLVLAAINSLGSLGDTTAYVGLSYVQYLDYSRAVKTAARKAIEQLNF
jgi:hypothetical protein